MIVPELKCELCGQWVLVTPYRRGIPFHVAALKQRCNADGCPSQPRYRPGLPTIMPRGMSS